MLGIHLLPVAEAQLAGFAFTNSPAAIPAWGGKKALFGTNPVAAVFPRKEQNPIVVDLALTTYLYLEWYRWGRLERPGLPAKERAIEEPGREAGSTMVLARACAPPCSGSVIDQVFRRRRGSASPRTPTACRDWRTP